MNIPFDLRNLVVSLFLDHKRGFPLDFDSLCQDIFPGQTIPKTSNSNEPKKNIEIEGLIEDLIKDFPPHLLDRIPINLISKGTYEQVLGAESKLKRVDKRGSRLIEKGPLSDIFSGQYPIKSSLSYHLNLLFPDSAFEKDTHELLDLPFNLYKLLRTRSPSVFLQTHQLSPVYTLNGRKLPLRMNLFLIEIYDSKGEGIDSIVRGHFREIELQRRVLAINGIDPGVYF